MNWTKKLLLKTISNSVSSNFLPDILKCSRISSLLAVSGYNVPYSTQVTSMQMKKRPVKKKKLSSTDGFRICAFSTAEEYNLEKLSQGITTETLFKQVDFNSDYANLIDAVHVVNASSNESESQHLFFFREGSVVMWNLSDSDITKILDITKNYEHNRFNENLIQDESETMTYVYSDNRNKTGIVSDIVVFSKDVDVNLEKYTISNAMAQSVHLGTFEANLQHYIDTMEPVTEDLKSGKRINMSRNEVLRKTGQLFALRHNINLNSDLLDTPDFYWEREELENLYQTMASYYCIHKRTRVMNEKINHCIELVHLLSSHLNDRHHVRLEWMIIILIMVEVVFEIIHFVDR